MCRAQAQVRSSLSGGGLAPDVTRREHALLASLFARCQSAHAVQIKDVLLQAEKSGSYERAKFDSEFESHRKRLLQDREDAAIAYAQVARPSTPASARMRLLPRRWSSAYSGSTGTNLTRCAQRRTNFVSKSSTNVSLRSKFGFSRETYKACTTIGSSSRSRRRRSCRH